MCEALVLGLGSFHTCVKLQRCTSSLLIRHFLPFPLLLIYSLLSRLQRSWPLQIHASHTMSYSHTLHTSDSSFKPATPPDSNTPSHHLITYTLGTFQQSHSISQNIPTCALLQENCLHMLHVQVSTIQFGAKQDVEFSFPWIVFFSPVHFYWCRVCCMVCLKMSLHKSLHGQKASFPLQDNTVWSSGSHCSHGSATWTQFITER